MSKSNKGNITMPALNYNFDPTGKNLSNLVVNEIQSVYSPGWKDYNFIIPKASPYFLDTMRIRHIATDRILTEGVEWLAGFHFSDASRSCAKPIYAGIMFIDPTISGEIELSYQTLGGDWLISEATNVLLLTQVMTNPRITTWEQIVELPFRFPTIDHEWNLVDMVGMSKVKDSLNTIAQTIEERPNPTGQVLSHTSNKNNPHDVTKEDLNLGYVNNFPISDTNDAKIGLRDDKYMTPKTTRISCEHYTYSKTEIDELLLNLQNQINNI